MDGTVSFSMECDLTPEQAAALLGLMDRRTYKCEGCECGRELLVARVASGFDVTLIDPEFEAYVHMTPAELAEWIDGGGDGFIGDGGDAGTIDLSEAQLADLRACALGEAAARWPNRAWRRCSAAQAPTA